MLLSDTRPGMGRKHTLVTGSQDSSCLKAVEMTACSVAESSTTKTRVTAALTIDGGGLAASNLMSAAVSVCCHRCHEATRMSARANPLTSLLMKQWLRAMVARVMLPHCADVSS